ncbi:MAG: hypothetical protein P4L84_16350 [Isosphaeraceae bacterium]|nr:hypothetical protein [Isosphaeraceae bacterium]
MAWRWTARRLLVSAFLVWHIGATLVAVSPPCPVKERYWPTVQRYVMPLGLWQFWSMFSPNPFRDTLVVEAEVVDSQGLRHVFAFPRSSDYSIWRAMPRFRYMKYTANLVGDDVDPLRMGAARHVLRTLNIPAASYPVDVHLYYKYRPIAPMGTPDDPMTPTKTHTVATYAFADLSEVRR